MNVQTVENVTWAITDGRTGTLSQARGLAEAVGLPVEVKTVHPRLPWTLLPVTTWPRLTIACGWRSIPYVLALKRLSAGKTLTVQLQRPRIGLRHFDLVVPPEHDNVSGPNVISMIGSPNGVTPLKLDGAAQQWSASFSNLPRPRVAALIGGASKSHRFGEADARHLAAQLKQLTSQGFAVMATTSRRTGDAQTKIIRETLAGANAYVWDGVGEMKMNISCESGFTKTCETFLNSYRGD